jgi:gas vesicle structural protein
MTNQRPPSGPGQPQQPGVGFGQEWPAAPPDYGQLRHRSPSERMAQGGSPLEPLERILDKGIVIDAWAEVRVLGIPLASLEARVVVASIETYLYYAESIMQLPPIARGPMAGPRAMGRVAGEAFSQEGLNPLLRATSQTVQGLGDTVNAAAGQATQMAVPQAQAQPEQQQQPGRQAWVAELERREQDLARREAALTQRAQPEPEEPEADEDEEPEAAPPRARRARGNGSG